MSLPDSIRVEVRPYDEEQRELLSRLPGWRELEALLQTGLSIPKPQFLVYSLFRLRDVVDANDLQRLVEHKEALLSAMLVSHQEFFTAHPTLKATEHRPEAQELGEAIGLGLMDAVYGTTDADWQRIPEGPRRTFDYVASNTDTILEIESKGSFVEDKELKPPTISKHKRDIIEKKEAARRHGGEQGVRLGTILAIDRKPGAPPIVWIVDPPVSYRERSPRDIRVLQRLSFILRWLALINPRSSLVPALATRLVDLTHLQDISRLDGVALSVVPPKSLSVEPSDMSARFFSTRSWVHEERAGGLVVPVKKDMLFFLGIREELVELAVSQNFDALTAYRARSAVVRRTVAGVVSRGRFKSYGFNAASARVTNTGQYFHIRIGGPLNCTSGGLVFGLIERPPDL